MDDVAAVILTHGEHESYRTVLRDLLAEGLPSENICIVHNPVAPTDASPTPDPPVHVIRMPGNDGYATGMNTGMRYHIDRGARWIWLLTHDVRLRAGALAVMVAAGAQDERLGAIGPILLDAGTDTVFSLGGERTPVGRAYHLGLGRPLQPRDCEGPSVRLCAWLDGSTIMLRARALESVGLYDTSMFGYTEDADLCLRLERAGWSIGVVRAAVAEQSAGALSRPGPVAFLLARNGLRYARAVGGRSALLPILRMQARDSLHLMRVVVTGPRRRVALIQCYATWVGVVASLAGRTGAPPDWLPGRGDMGPAFRRFAGRRRTADRPRSR